ncbi:MAG: hypothetical protein ACR2PS_16690 [Pseudomonadales bacterium]
MADIDLIPQEYRYWLWQLNWLKRSAVGLSTLLVLATAGYFYLDITANTTQQKLQALQQQKAITQQQQHELEQLSNSKEELARQWHLLNGLRGGTSVESILAVIDKALLDKQVWFLDWQFARAGQAAKRKRQTSNTGYFVVASGDSKGEPAMPDRWQVDTHITIKGQAIDHAAFSGFVQRLLSQAEIADVKVVKTALSRISDINIVDFDIAILVNNAGETG